jgi:TP901 family phage tail tape measure protein|uniref:Minor tail protein n=1 Tax=Siphoviridae sp. ctxYv12 TaxID=2827974 RepID=A0A8S5S4T4_9CAUD|nr:MAG TPA: minor tail protein [Siphoviridae sp. ctxYv12]
MSDKKLKTVIEVVDKYSKELKDFSKKINETNDELKKLQDNFAKGSDGAKKLSDSLSLIKKVGVGAAVLYVGNKIKDLGKFAIESASKMDELANVTRQVFESSTKEIEQWAKTIDKEVGRSIYQMQNFASVYGSMFKGAGFDTSFFKKISKDLATFTADFSSFFNVTDDEAFTAIKGALTGETEALKRYGLILNDTTMAEYALSQGIKEKWQNLDTATKMQLRYNKLMEMTTYIQGDASRTIDGYANSLKKAEGLIDNIATSIGYKLLPFATKVVHMFNGIAEAVDDMLSKKSSTDYLFDFVKEKQNLDDLKNRYVELSKMYLEGLGTPESERERNEIYERLLAMYPDLIGKIGKEAEAYYKVAEAIEVVIRQLKEKALAEYASDKFKEIIADTDKDLKTVQKKQEEREEQRLRLLAETGVDYSKISSRKLKKISELHERAANGDEKAQEELGKLTRRYGGRTKKGFIKTGSAGIIEYANDEKTRKNISEEAQKKAEENLKKRTAEFERGYNSLANTLDIVSNSNLSKTSTTKEYEKNIKELKGKVQSTKEKYKEINELDKIATENAEQLLSNWKSGKYNNANLEKLREIHKKIVASGIDPVAASEIQSNITHLESLEGKTEKTAKAIKTHSKSIVKSAEDIYNAFQKDFQNQINYDDIIGTSDIDKIKNQISILKRYIKEAVDNGNIDLAKSLQTQLQEKEFKIKKFDIDEALDKVQEKIEDLEINFSKGKISEENYHEERAKVLGDLIKTYEKHNIDLEKLSEEDARHLRESIEMAKQKKKASEDEVEHLQAIAFKLKKVNEALDSINSLASSFSQLGQVTGSKSIGNIGGILSNIFNIGTSFNNLGDIKSIAKIFSGGLKNFTAGMNSLSSLVGIATGGLGIVKTLGSVIGFGKGKNKAAEIDNRNRENENRYQEQIKAMQTLTEALKKNADYVKNFTDRILTEAAKNPTLSFLSNSNRNIDLFQQAMLNGKHFSDISALEKGSQRYSRGFGRRKKSKDTYTAVSVGEAQLLKYLGFDKTELDNFNDSEIRQLNNVLKNVSHNDLVKATGRNLTQSNLDEWKKQISEFVSQLDLLEKEKKDLFRGSTLDSFTGIDYSSEKKLIQEYTEQFKQMGLVGEQYNETIKEMARNNQVLVTAMQDVRAQTIEGLASGNGGFVTSMKSYFEKIFKNASSIAYDVAFSDLDRYFNDEFKKISEKLVNIKKTGKLNFNDLLSGIDFSKLKLAEGIETQAKKSLDTIKQFLLSRGIDISIINKILPNSDFNDKLNDMKNALSNAMNEAQKEKKFDSFTKSLGESLYESTKASLIKAFSESSVYQGLISKFVNTEDMKAEIEKAGTFEGAFNIIKNKLKDFGYRLESNGLGGFDAINNKDKADNQLGNAYYQDKSSNVEIKVTNNFYEKVYGVDDLEGRILKSVNIGIEAWTKKPKVTP